ncbi:hypothetical protein MKK67_29070 [Methylobacterium sp. J-072]|uniref:hypothetical protein n=1 Tax=Methylobacterium sp. J-072 TaxID=2836651 RepID=UPI001FBB6B42|nr:hypothetical protein [Methylobacterium sp. J-072]MCJ2096528.1 hypothetical protein [Methylobacterium sp. J-072]
MPDEPKISNTQTVADMEYDAERWARVGAEHGTDPKKVAPAAETKPEVGLSQKGTNEDAIVKRETDI